MIYECTDIITAGGPMSAAVGAFRCEDTNPAFAIYHAVDAGLTERLDPFDESERLVASFDCRDGLALLLP